ncbi:hypothetical protein HWI79_1966 [Cryptosporidium felis]|nr:hypothetical protein HWI79_1966 [Cryptosporidium felis]
MVKLQIPYFFVLYLCLMVIFVHRHLLSLKNFPKIEKSNLDFRHWPRSEYSLLQLKASYQQGPPECSSDGTENENENGSRGENRGRGRGRGRSRSRSRSRSKGKGKWGVGDGASAGTSVDFTGSGHRGGKGSSKSTQLLITTKRMEISNFKEKIGAVKASIEKLLLKLILECISVFKVDFSGMGLEETKELILDHLSGLVGRKFLKEVNLPFITTIQDLQLKYEGIDGLEELLEKCLNIIYTLLEDLASYFDKKSKIKELKREIEVLALD